MKIVGKSPRFLSYPCLKADLRESALFFGFIPIDEDSLDLPVRDQNGNRVAIFLKNGLVYIFDGWKYGIDPEGEPFAHMLMQEIGWLVSGMKEKIS